MAAAAAVAMAAIASARVAVRSSWEIENTPMPPIVPTRTTKPPRTTTIVVERERPLSPAQLLSSTDSRSKKEKLDEQYLGFERWLPLAPKVKSPRSIYNAASLAYIGDCIYELYARRHFLYPPLSINDFNDRVMKVVRCEAQDALLKKLLSEEYLTEDERDVLRWGKNMVTSKTRTKKRAGVAVYNSASSLETLIGYLYLTDVKRLEELMYRLGFSSGASSESILELRAKFKRPTSDALYIDIESSQ